MTPEEFDVELPKLLQKMTDILSAKSHDYAGVTDRFANFRLCEMAGIPTWKGVVIRISDKVSRILNFCKAEECKVKDESIEDTLLDCANYCLICLMCYRERKPGARLVSLERLGPPQLINGIDPSPFLDFGRPPHHIVTGLETR